MAHAYQETEWDGKEAIKLLRRLSFKQCLEHLLSGFIKKHGTKLQYSIHPFVLQQISIKYLGQKFFIRFKSSLTSKTKVKLINEHLVEARSCNSLLIDLPIPVKDDTFKIKWNIKFKVNALSNGHYFVGIVGDKFKHFNSSLWYGLDRGQESYSGIFGLYGNELWAKNFFSETIFQCYSTFIWNSAQGNIGNNREEFMKHFEKIGKENYQNNEIITCEYDGQLKELNITKLKTKELICYIKLTTKPRIGQLIHWYPVIRVRSSGDQVEIM